MTTKNDAAEEALRAGAKRLFERIYAFYDVKVLAVASSLGLFEALANERLDPDALALKAGAAPRGTRAVLVGLVVLGLVDEVEGRYGLTELGRRHFLPGAPGYLGGMVEFANWQFDALPRLDEAVRDDRIVWEGFEHYIEGTRGVEDPKSRERQDRFNQGLAAGAESTAHAVMAKVDFGRTKSLLDVGGNLGVFSGTILRKHAGMSATVFDLPQVAAQVNADVMKLGLGDRLRAVGGDFTKDAYPTGHDTVAFIRILNSRSDDVCRLLLRKAFEALPSGGRCIFYDEHVLAERPADNPHGALWGALFLLISSPGEVRTGEFWASLFREAGFTSVEVARGKQSGVVVGTKP